MFCYQQVLKCYGFQLRFTCSKSGMEAIEGVVIFFGIDEKNTKIMSIM